jgi:putative peptidoglycan lipid II flippase
MSRAVGGEAEVAAHVRGRLANGLQQVAFFVIPSAVAFAALGDLVAATILQTGRFRHEDALYVWGILAGSAIGLLASTFSRLYASAFWALRDTRTPLRYAMVRVALTAVLGTMAALWLPRLIGIDARWGAAGLTAFSGLSACVELLLLRRGLSKRVGAVELPPWYLGRLWLVAVSAAAVAWLAKLALPPGVPLLRGLAALVPFGLAYLGFSAALGVPQARRLWTRLSGSK